MTQIGSAENDFNLIILDACRNNPFERSFRSSGRGLARIEDTPTGTLIAYSAKPGQVASDGKGTSNSPFTTALAEAIREPGLEISPLLRQVRSRVRQETKNAQTTWDEGAITGEFYFSQPNDRADSPVRQDRPEATDTSIAADFRLAKGHRIGGGMAGVLGEARGRGRRLLCAVGAGSIGQAGTRCRFGGHDAEVSSGRARLRSP